jgi:hypothetical protein
VLLTVLGEELSVMAATQQLDDLVTSLEQSVDAGLAYFEGPGSTSRVKLGRYGPREILCQLVWWHQATLEGLESVAAGGAPYRIYASVDEMNARAVGRFAAKSLQQLLVMGREAQTKLVKAARACTDPGAVVVVMGDGQGRSLQQRLEVIAPHWQEQVKALQTGVEDSQHRESFGYTAQTVGHQNR